MNARILKKLCKRAAPLIRILDPNREVFAVGENDYIPSWVDGCMERKSRSRFRGKVYGDYFEPLIGTMAIGYMSRGEEPEWSDEPCWDALRDHILDNFMVLVGDPDKDLDACSWRLTLKDASIGNIFRIAERLCDDIASGEKRGPTRYDLTH